MVMKADVLDRALTHAMGEQSAHVVLLSPQGSHFRQADAGRLAAMGHVVLVCGHYEGLDQRFVQARVDEEFSLGDFVLTGGEIPAMAVMDAVSRLIPGVLGDPASCQEDSFYHGLLDCPHYTRPGRWGEKEVPAVLASGDHGAVANWRRRQAMLATLIRRPDLLDGAKLDKAERRILTELAKLLEQDSGELYP